MFYISFYLNIVFLLTYSCLDFSMSQVIWIYDSFSENIFRINHELEYFFEGELLFTFYNISTLIHHFLKIAFVIEISSKIVLHVWVLQA